MIKIEGENGIILKDILKCVQKRCGLKDEKETLKRVIDALQRDGVILTLCNMIEMIDKENSIIDAIEADAHTCNYNSRGECEICGAIQHGSPLYRELYGGE